jgi:hypothetical protein
VLVARDVVVFYGHELIKGTHRSTFEITTEDFLGPKGDCIIGINASKSCYDLDPLLKKMLKNDNAKVTLTLMIKELFFKISARGSKQLTLSDNKSMVIRTSNFISPRTLAIRASSSAYDLPRSMINALKRKDRSGIMILEATIPH